ncbi:type II toxin-antitoxin system PemK/MazF family toxin [Candidatus Woesearchaeota archaeon]|nr:type II toxin-antitoxin system PemK/MazF family toxin [Candidatus Woesearchaeota archaeon]
METLVKGDIVVVPFPFSDLSAAKKRPVVVVAQLDGDDVILCQITSIARSDAYALPLTFGDFASGALPQASIIRPNRIFTAERSIISYKAGSLKVKKIKEVENVLVKLITS